MIRQTTHAMAIPGIAEKHQIKTNRPTTLFEIFQIQMIGDKYQHNHGNLLSQLITSITTVIDRTSLFVF